MMSDWIQLKDNLRDVTKKIELDVVLKLTMCCCRLFVYITEVGDLSESGKSPFQEGIP